MLETAALRVALNMLHMPATVRRVKNEPLPAGVGLLLQIVAGEDQARREAAVRTERPEEMVKAAASFFVEQILLAPDTGPYRTLGATLKATNSELRHNMALLLRWLHPDKAQSDDRRALVERVTLAWEKLKTPERRAAYDASRTDAEPHFIKAKGKRRRPATTISKATVRRQSGEGVRRHLEPPERWRSISAGSLLRRAYHLFFGR